MIFLIFLKGILSFLEFLDFLEMGRGDDHGCFTVLGNLETINFCKKKERSLAKIGEL